MSNRYSYAHVLSHYEARGLTAFTNPYLPKPRVRRRTRKTAPPLGIYSFSASTSPSARSASSQEVPSLVSSGDSGGSLRTTPSIITEIFAPEHSLPPLFEPLDSVVSLASSGSLGVYTPRTSVSLVGPLVSPEKYGRRGSLPPDLLSNQAATALSYSPSIRGLEGSEDSWFDELFDPIHEESMSIELGLLKNGRGNDPSGHPDPYAKDQDQHSLSYVEDFSSFLLGDIERIDSISRPQSYPEHSRRSSLSDDAAPPPIARHRSIQAQTPKKSDRSSLSCMMTSIKRRTVGDGKNELIGHFTKEEIKTDGTTD